MQDEAVLALLTSMDAIKEGEYILSNGKKTNLYIEMGILLQHPDIVGDFAEQLSSIYFGKDIDVVCSNAPKAIALGHEIAKQLEIKHIYAEREGEDYLINKELKIEKNQKVLVVDDVINTGDSLEKICARVKEKGGKISGICCIVDRAEEPLNIKPDIKSLLALRLPQEEVETKPKKTEKKSVKKTTAKKTAAKKK